ncbi:protein aurora borealis-like isoform X1 [Acipenser ruthenus]|uniref:protein aurora borealis-like isoform X1 n=1 Tax=Acipenser ruthenus TaxID=7906 RepID=UPI00145A1D0D|nr:protein aurora borealis-like isoform X1 [Acipenser ruthenus]
MGDTLEVGLMITPETPGRPRVLNPFESPSDYHSLHESIVASPSVFKSSRTSSATPGKFKWSIDQIASLNPVDIDPEDIHQQSLYMSQVRTDTEIEERRQKAIEEFFTKNMIVPSPWTQPEVKIAAQFHSTRCPISPLEHAVNIPPGKTNATCQTLLSLPVDFDLEKILGDYYKTEEAADQSHESLCSSSLRRKLFLDGIGSESEVSSPPTPERSPCVAPVGSNGVLSSSDLSPVHCKTPVETPSSGQFSSSPIQGGSRACSLGSVTSPTFPERILPCYNSPILSPISLQSGKTPGSAERRKLNFLSPDGASLGSSSCKVNSCTGSPFVEGCSPIRSCSPMGSSKSRAVLHGRASPIQLSFTLEPTVEDKEHFPPMGNLASIDVDTFSLHSDAVAVKCESFLITGGKRESASSAIIDSRVPLEQIEESKENSTVDMADQVETAEDDSTWAKGDDNTNIPLTSSRTGSISYSHSPMCLSLLVESSAIPCDSNSMQVDSGYNTHSTGISSIIDGISSENCGKELLDIQMPDETLVLCSKPLHFKSKLHHIHH